MNLLIISISVLFVSIAATGCAGDRGGIREPLCVIRSLNEPARFASSDHGEVAVLATDVTPQDSGDKYFAGRLLSIQLTSGGTVVAEHRFQSSYGLFRLELIDLDGDHEPEYVLISGQGQGTSVRQEWLEVLSERDGVFRQLCRTPYSGFFGSGLVWHYQHQYRGRDSNGRVGLVLHLEHDTPRESNPGNPELIPAVSIQALKFAPVWSRKRAQPGGPANGSQPSGSETNRTASAAGSRR